LVSRCGEVLHGKGFVAPEPLNEEQRALVSAAVESGRGEVSISSEGKVATVVLAVPARGELLAPAAGVLALHSLEVHSAMMRGYDGGRAGVFTASPRFGSLPDTGLLREQFARAVAGTLPLTQRLAEKERDYAAPRAQPAEPKVLWFDDETSGSETVVLELRAGDRIGLLFRVAGALRRCDVEVRWAKVATLGDAVVDSFAVEPRSGKLDQAWRDRVAEAVLTAAS
jgi:[protein-PII] uridylyltransferase